MPPVRQFISDFYQRNLFERIIVYIFLSAFLVKLIFELGLGQWYFVQAQHLQWIFYSLLALDYLLSIPKVINIRVSMNPMSAFAVICLIMVVHGLFIGLLRHNSPFIIINDTIPILMIALNILRMQSITEYKPIDYKFVLFTCTYLAMGACLLGLVAHIIGRPSQPSLGNVAIFLPLIFSAAFMFRPMPKWIMFVAPLMMALVLDDFNRTTMMFMFTIVFVYVGAKLIKAPVFGILAVLSVVVIMSISWIAIPKESKTYQRIVGLQTLDLTKRKGSVGERQAEWDAIQMELKDKGRTIEWVGLGFGGTYEVKFTHEYIRDYGHAHYSWSWFSLRYGKVGFFYLFVMVAVLFYNVRAGIRLQTPTSIFVAFLCFMGLIFCMTHVNSIFLLSGIHFFYLGVRKMGDDTNQTNPERKLLT